jgi:hypothetical protein
MDTQVPYIKCHYISDIYMCVYAYICTYMHIYVCILYIHTYIYKRVLFSHKNEILWFEGKWIQLEDIMLSEVSQAQKDEGHMFSLICGR